MPIQPVSGEIKAQPLNENFSFLDSKVDQVSGGPKETFTSVSNLQSKYPSGSNSAMLVTDANGSNGYLYTWNGTSWIKGPLYQPQGIANGAITTKKLSKESVTEEKTVFFEKSKNLFDKDSIGIRENKGYSGTTSTVVDTANYNISDRISSNGSEKVVISVNGSEVSSTSNYKVISFSDDVWVSTVIYNTGGISLESGVNSFEIQYNNTATNIQVEFDTLTAYEPFKVALKDTYTKHIQVIEDMLQDNVVSPQKTSFFEVGTGKNLFDPNSTEIQVGRGYSGETSTVVDAANYNISGKMYGQPNESIFVSVNNSLPASNNDLKFIEYDANNQWIKTKPIGSTGTEVLSANTGYFLIQYRPAHVNVMVSLGQSEPYEPFKKQVKNQYVKIEEESQIKSGLITKDMLAFDIDDGSVRTKEIDLIVFAGQSNMGGRGTASQAPIVKEGVAYEFRAISDPTKLYPVTEPFGAAENKEGGISETTKTGSLVSSLVNNYYAFANRKIVGISASQGGTRIGQWQSDGTLLPDAIERLNTAVAWLESNEYKIANKWLVWCQGEGDGTIATTAADYKAGLSNMITAFETAGINHTFLIRTGNNRDDPTKYDVVIQAQTEFCQEEDNTTLIATTFDRFASDGLMKDEFHYLQEGYNRCGQQAGKNLAYYVSSGKEPTMFDWENQNLYFSHKAD
ncbi:sialate O-acetylesterase [Enterococcus casseliflavus]|uniref:sialate O-acetylesterase n=1 Tax=Enterococcus casseliflavus TaxID=37734 RepID=UPI0039A66A43